jgi:hypothetical protein
MMESRDVVCLLFETCVSTLQTKPSFWQMVSFVIPSRLSGNARYVTFAEKVLPFLLRCIETGGFDAKTIACSALLALVYNSQKVIDQC